MSDLLNSESGSHSASGIFEEFAPEQPANDLGKLASMFNPESEDPEDLEQIAEVQNDAQNLWKDGDLKLIFDETMRSPVEDIDQLIPGKGDRVAFWAQEVIPPIESFGDALLHQSAPIGLLKLIKSYGKVADKDPSEPLPQSVARVLYYGAIASALVHHGEAISSLPRERLRESFGSRCNLEWVDPTIRDLLKQAMEQLSGEAIIEDDPSDGAIELA